MADNCGTCLTLSEKYKCGWCQSTSTCEVAEQCLEKNSDWLDRLQTCPNPEINSFTPITGPVEGGTNITINGINLGKKFVDIYSSIRIAGIDFMAYQNLYVDTKKIVCQIDETGFFQVSNRQNRCAW